jgi:hypothetical protein
MYLYYNIQTVYVMSSGTAISHIQRLTSLKDGIEAMAKVHHPDVLRILDKHGIVGSENKNGTFINLSCASEDVIAELESHILYVKEQEKQLSEVEEQKKQLATKYFTASRHPVKK